MSSLLLSLVIEGAPRTKKNHGRTEMRGRRKVHLPSVAHDVWHAAALPQAKVGRCGPALTSEVNCRALFFRDALRGDAVGYYQALADLLEHAGIVENDRLIVSWDGSRLRKDAARPRIEVELWTADS
jgi:hypothetical protein